MGKCAVKECKSRSQNHTKAFGITFHTVPKDLTRRRKWMEIIRKLRKETDWIPTKSTVICSKHFRTEDKIASKSVTGRVYLTEEAVPMLDTISYIPTNETIIVEEKRDSDEEFDEMRETIKCLTFLSKQRLKKIKKLTLINGRLKRNTKILKDIIKDLKQKHMKKLK